MKNEIKDKCNHQFHEARGYVNKTSHEVRGFIIKLSVMGSEGMDHNTLSYDK